MTLKSQMQADILTVFFNTDDFAVLVDYTVAATSLKTTGLKAIPDFDLKQNPTEYGAADMVDWLIPYDSMKNPQVYDVIEHDSVSYRIMRVLMGDLNGTWRVTCEVDRRQKPGNVT